MQSRHVEIQLWIALLAAFALLNAAGAKESQPKEDLCKACNLVPVFSREQAWRDKVSLANVTDKNVPKEYDGGILFEGTVTEISGPNSSGLWSYLVRVRH